MRILAFRLVVTVLFATVLYFAYVAMNAGGSDERRRAIWCMVAAALLELILVFGFEALH